MGEELYLGGSQFVTKCQVDQDGEDSGDIWGDWCQGNTETLHVASLLQVASLTGADSWIKKSFTFMNKYYTENVVFTSLPKSDYRNRAMIE